MQGHHSAGTRISMPWRRATAFGRPRDSLLFLETLRGWHDMLRERLVAALILTGGRKKDEVFGLVGKLRKSPESVRKWSVCDRTPSLKKAEGGSLAK